MHPLFKDNVSSNEILFKNLNKICLVIPGFEVANCVLVPLNGMMIHFQKFLSLPRKKKQNLSAGALLTPYIVPILTLIIKHMSELLTGKDFSDSSTKDDNYIDAKNGAGFFQRFLVVCVKGFLFLRNFLNLIF